MSSVSLLLSSLFKSSKKVKSLETYISTQVPDEQLSEVLYHLYGHVVKQTPPEKVEAEIREKKFGWQSCLWQQQRDDQKALDEFITNPMEVVSGVMKCEKCKSDKVYTVQKQLRSADEGFSSISQCTNCGARWRIN